jgi:hypothetical protein
MSLYIRSKNQGEIPEGAVRINEEQALRYQTKIFRDWPTWSEV